MPVDNHQLDVAPLKEFYTHGVLPFFRGKHDTCLGASSESVHFHNSPSLFYFILKWTIGCSRPFQFLRPSIHFLCSETVVFQGFFVSLFQILW